MKIQDNLFDLTEKQVESSKSMYDGKVIKCLVAPYHSYDQLGEMIKYSRGTYLFPEREMNSSNVRSFISMVVRSQITDEIRIITTSMSIIQDMVDSSVRVLTERGDVVDCPIKTFMANIHDIRYSLLENEKHQTSEVEKSVVRKKIDDLIDRINSAKKTGLSTKEIDKLEQEAKVIGEPIIRNKLREMITDIDVV